MISGQRISELKRHGRLGLLVAVSTLALTGCINPFGQGGYFRDRSGDYTAAKVSTPIQLPDNFQSRELDDILVIPEISQPDQQLSREFEVPRPPRRFVMREGHHYSLERSGNREWLFVDRDASKVWIGVLGYLNELGVGIATRDSTKRVVETQWNDFGVDKDRGLMYRTLSKRFGIDGLDPIEDRFRIEVRGGLKEGTTEVHVYHQGRTLPKKGKESSAPVRWDNFGERSRRVDNGVLTELLAFLTQDETESSFFLQAQGLDVGSHAEMGLDGNGNQVLTIRGWSYAHVWDSVSDALDKAGFEVVDRNRSAGLFYLADRIPQLKQTEKKKSFWSSWFDDEDVAVSNEKKTLTVRVSNYSEVVQLSVERDVNTSAPEDISRRLLKAIKNNL